MSNPPRVSDETLDHLLTKVIYFENWQNELRDAARDLRDARARTVELERELERLRGLADSAGVTREALRRIEGGFLRGIIDLAIRKDWKAVCELMQQEARAALSEISPTRAGG